MKTKSLFSRGLKLFVLLALFAPIQSLYGQVLVPFTQRAAQSSPSKLIYNIRGDFTMIGNTNLTLENYSDTRSNNFPMEYVDVDGDSQTFNSSTSELQFSTENGAIPQCSNILFAGLYWTGRAQDGGNSPMEFNVTKGGITKTFNKRKVKIKGPGQANYTEIEANPGDIYYPSAQYGNMYSGFAEVTQYVKDNGLGDYTVADIALVEGAGGGTGYYGGWGLVVVYENSQMNWRDVTIFDGHAYVAGGITANYELPISGFNTVQSGNVNMKVGMIAGEGDRNISGDYFQIRNWQNTNWITLNHSGNSTNNFFNSSVFTGGNPRNPSILNNTGVDISMFDIPNPSNSIIANNQTSTTFRYGTTQDTYTIFCLAMAVDAYIPDVEALVSTESINGVPANTPGLTVEPGDIIQYTVDLKNLGTEAVEDIQLTVPVPYMTSFEPGSISTQINYTPAPSPNNAAFDATMGATGSVVWDLEYLPLPPVINPDSVLASLTFEFKVTEDCYILTNPDCPPEVILSGGQITGIGQVSGSGFRLPFIQGYQDAGLCIGEPISDPIVLDIDEQDYVDNFCMGFPQDRNYLFCDYEQTFIPFDSIAQNFPPGLGFYNTNTIGSGTIAYNEDNPFPATPGTNTYFAIPFGINLCYYSFTITVQGEIQTSAIITSSESCIGSTDGSINLTVSGGTLPYTFDWTGPSGYTSPNQNISNLGAGFYEVLITDDIGCTAEDTATVSLIPDVTNPFLSCTSNISQSNDLGDCGSIVNYSIPVGSDNCPGVTTTLTAGLSSGSVFPVGTTTVTYTATDAAGNTETCSFDVTVNDTEIPSISSCPTTITISNDGGDCGAVVTWVAPAASDNCGVNTFTSTHNSGDVFPVGTTTVTYTATDAAGNTETCSFDVTVNDTEIPSISSCPTTITISNDGGDCGAVVTWVAPAASDNCGVNTFTSTHNSGDVFPVGTTTVTYTATDAAGNTETCSFDVTVNDTEIPTILCQPTVNSAADLNNCFADASGVNLGTPVTGDNCGVATVTNNAPAQYPVGSTVVIWTVTDVNGNSATCQQIVNITDDQAPIISNCGVTGSQTVNTDLGLCTYTNTGTGWDVIATDNCTATTAAYTLTGATVGTGTSLNGVVFNPGTTTVTWTVTDGSMNSSVCSFDIVVEDDENPVISNCGVTGSQTVNADLGLCTYTNTGTGWDVIATDNCTAISAAYALTGATVGTGTSLNGVVFNPGTTSVTWTVTDGSMNSSVCSFDIVVEDDENPVISNCGVTGSQTVNADLGLCTYTNTGTGWDVIATDNCTATTAAYALTGATVGTGTSLNGVVFNSGTTTVTWTVTDGSMNSSVCSFDIVVEDDENPVIMNCPVNITVSNDASICGAVATWSIPTATDNCTVASFTSTHNPGDTFPVGSTTVTYTATDALGNTAVCEFTVTVTDNEDPTISSCPTNISISNDLGECNAIVGWTIPTALDNCSVTSFTSSHNPGDVFAVGTTTVTYTATDAAGNTETCSFDVTVNDTENPTIICQPSVTVTAEPGECYAVAGNVNLGTPVPGDNCGVATVTNNAPTQYPVGITSVTWTVLDVNGNSSSCIQTVTVLDNQDPIINNCGVIGNITESADNGECSFTNNGTAWDVDATDNCTNITVSYQLTGATIGTGSTLDGVPFNLGVTSVVWTVTDDAGNEISCSYTVTVEDNENPTVIGCPNNIAQNVDFGQCGAEVSWIAPTFSDNCVGASITSNFSPGDFFAVGTTTVVYTVTDGSGNLETCSFDITVTDNEAPLLNCPTNIASCDSLITYNLPTATDNCGVASVQLISGLPSGSIFPVGISQVTYEATDIHGNTSTCTFDVEVYETPEVTGIVTDVTCNGLDNGTITLTLSAGQSPFTFIWNNGETDQNLTDLTPGIYSVEVIDANGCTTADAFEVVQPDELIVAGDISAVLCYGDANGAIDANVTGGALPYTYQWSNGEVTEDISGVLVGNYELTVTDFNGCESTEVFNVSQPDSLFAETTVLDATCTAPNGGILVEHFGGTGPFTYEWSDGSTDLNLSNVEAGVYTLTITDANGCSKVIEEEIETISYINAEVAVTNVLCFGNENGSAVVTADLGNPPFSYEWSHGPKTPLVDGLAAGDYTVTVTDAFGCSNTIDVEITEPDPIEVDLFSPDLGNGFNILPYGNDNGSISADAFGGTPPYSFDWTDGSNSENLSNLTAGIYSVIVTDANGCSVRAGITLEQPMVLEMPSGISPNNDDKNDFFVVRGIEAYPENEIRVFNRWGNLVYQKNNYANEWQGENSQGKALPDGTYFVIFHAFTTDGDITLKGYVDIRRTK